MNAADVAGLLEVVAAERPELLRPLVKALEYSRAAAGVADLGDVWGIGAPGPEEEDRGDKLFEIAAKTSAGLDQLERKRAFGWNHPRELIDGANVAALQGFAHQRRVRVRNARREARLSLIARKLDQVAEADRRRRAVERFLGEPVQPVDPKWLREFLKR